MTNEELPTGYGKEKKRNYIIPILLFVVIILLGVGLLSNTQEQENLSGENEFYFSNSLFSDYPVYSCYTISNETLDLTVYFKGVYEDIYRETYYLRYLSEEGSLIFYETWTPPPDMYPGDACTWNINKSKYLDNFNGTYELYFLVSSDFLSTPAKDRRFIKFKAKYNASCRDAVPHNKVGVTVITGLEWTTVGNIYENPELLDGLPMDEET